MKISYYGKEQEIKLQFTSDAYIRCSVCRHQNYWFDSQGTHTLPESYAKYVNNLYLYNSTHFIKAALLW